MGKVKQALEYEIVQPEELLRQNLKRSSTKTVTKDGKVKKKVAKTFTTFQCQYCKKKFDDKGNCASHEKIHSNDSFACSHCPYKAKVRKYLVRHQKKVHSDPKKHKCSVCGKMFHYECKLREHVMVHTGEKPHKCNVCGKAFRVTFSLNAHMLIHTNEKPYKCSFCDYSCRDNSTLRKHENRHMGVVKTFRCKLCPKKFPEKAKLKYHISEVHLDYLELDLKGHSCELCGKAFRCKYNLNKHVQAVHEKSLVCNCPICGQQLSNKNNLSAHLRTHFDVRPYACKHPKCRKTFKDKGTLKKHTIIHQPHLHHPCRVCGATFSRAHRLTKHLLTHETRSKWAECDYCGVSFYTKNYLIKHIKKKHAKNKQKYVCDRCGLVTYNKPSIVMHLKYGHLHDNDLYCKICKTKYKRHMYLKAHYLRTHNIKYKTMKRRKRKDKKLSVEVKVEPLDPDDTIDDSQLMAVEKEEISEVFPEEDPENDYLSYSKQVLSEDLAGCILEDQQERQENTFDEFLYKHVFHKKKVKEEPEEDDIDEEQLTMITQKVKDIMKNTEKIEAAKALKERRKKEAIMLKKKLRKEAKTMCRKRRQEIIELEKVRQLYNERMKAAVAAEQNKKVPVKTIKYYQQRTTVKIQKQPDEANKMNTENLPEVANDGSLDKDNNNDINDVIEDSRDKVTNSNENLSKNAGILRLSSSKANENDVSLNDRNESKDTTDEVNLSNNNNIISDDTALDAMDTNCNNDSVNEKKDDSINDSTEDGLINDQVNSININNIITDGTALDAPMDTYCNNNSVNENKDDSINDSTKDGPINDEVNSININNIITDGTALDAPMDTNCNNNSVNENKDDSINDSTKDGPIIDEVNSTKINNIVTDGTALDAPMDTNCYNDSVNENKDDSINDSTKDGPIIDEVNSININNIVTDCTALAAPMDTNCNNDSVNENKNYLLNDAKSGSINDDSTKDGSINDDNAKVDSINDDNAKDDSINDDNAKVASIHNDNAKDDSINDDNAKDDSINGDEKSDNDSNYEPDFSEDESTEKKKLTFKSHQCYICFMLYPTKEDLIAHCQSHFDICNSTTLAKCPICAHVASGTIGKHMLKAHQIEVKIPYNRITDRKKNDTGSRYCYEMDDKGTMIEIIPSVKVLNYNASIQIDKNNREKKDKTVARTKLVKKGTEWIVENVAVKLSFVELPEFSEKELSKLQVSDNYVDRLGQLSRLAKEKGLKMMFPCDGCDKICQNFSGLKLHSRRHDPNKKPFAPRKHKRNAKPAPAKKPEINLANRLAKPKPIQNKHKCDEKLKRFYETHIRGADIEFWQFLKIFNKMDRENIQDFKDFEGRTEFGIHTNEDRDYNEPHAIKARESSLPTPKLIRAVTKIAPKQKSAKISKKQNGKSLSSRLRQNSGVNKLNKRGISITKKQNLDREKAKMKLRKSLAKKN